jgi:hypothetical protein
MAFSASAMAPSRVLPCPDILTPATVARHFQKAASDALHEGVFDVAIFHAAQNKIGGALVP